MGWDGMGGAERWCEERRAVARRGEAMLGDRSGGLHLQTKHARSPVSTGMPAWVRSPPKTSAVPSGGCPRSGAQRERASQSRGMWQVSSKQQGGAQREYEGSALVSGAGTSERSASKRARVSGAGASERSARRAELTASGARSMASPRLELLDG